jgi:ATP-dependent Clp protease ATP-binding subunit ClpC
LFDEIEKAHPEVFNILLQVLDNGHLTDSKGRKVNFKNSVIIMTSNIGSEHIAKMQTFGFGEGTEVGDYEATKTKVMESLRNFFRPEFLNRLDEILLFDILTPESITEIVRIQVDKVKTRLASKDVALTVSDDVLTYLAKEGYDPKYGARPLKRLIQNKILNKVAEHMIESNMLTGATVHVEKKGEEIVVRVEKRRRGKSSPIEVPREKVLT